MGGGGLVTLGCEEPTVGLVDWKNADLLCGLSCCILLSPHTFPFPPCVRRLLFSSCWPRSGGGSWRPSDCGPGSQSWAEARASMRASDLPQRRLSLVPDAVTASASAAPVLVRVLLEVLRRPRLASLRRPHCPAPPVAATAALGLEVAPPRRRGTAGAAAMTTTTTTMTSISGFRGSLGGASGGGSGLAKDGGAAAAVVAVAVAAATTITTTMIGMTTTTTTTVVSIRTTAVTTTTKTMSTTMVVPAVGGDGGVIASESTTVGEAAAAVAMVVPVPVVPVVRARGAGA